MALAADVRHVGTVVGHATTMVHNHLHLAHAIESLAREVGGVDQVLVISEACMAHRGGSLAPL